MEENIIAQRIKSIRTEKELTLEEVAKRTGFTKGLISKIENNKVSPPVSTLVKIAKALDVSLGDLFSPSDALQIKIVRKEQRLKYSPENLPNGQVIETLVSGYPRQKIEPLMISIEDPDNYKTKLYNHPGQEFIYILAGAMKYLYGDEEYLVSEGDSIYFNAENTHGPSPLSGQKVKYLALLCP
ncbi:transcriptional regulator, XRE family with cupin sensor [Desulfotomaculum arcticum]|uniref:Transcriptional regulator, XRE family with cupin sensor n=1 Tax=Desulfotruncus arcticus DSM 17038 TaxID=1121424 RepID=A0A1I2RFR8_9FIRM|nr:XRE family transcriptional regulator [Desulfotruncus arcticus]SFG39322.1 transcriptional regulator, XRE family with cupin sensor [Desulfotomaculum arcticum] [Desulfotruncus arcticus DSM 17038]